MRTSRTLARRLSMTICSTFVAATFVWASPASAIATCWSEATSSNSGRSFCSTATRGATQTRVRIVCYDLKNDISVTYYGPWVGLGRYSNRTCDNSYGTVRSPGSVYGETR